ncbi:MAG: hypothetical protein WD572_04950 [Gammaproteobacteria bacterium]
MTDVNGAAALQLESASSSNLRAPLFAALVEHLRQDQRWVILDLGPAQSASIRFFNRFRCRLDIADLPADLTTLNGTADKHSLRQQCEAILPPAQNNATDVVLCWSLLNYLERPALTAMMATIAARARPGTLVHALIVYSASHMPVQPNRYHPIVVPAANGDDSIALASTTVTVANRDAPRYTPDDLARCMPRYQVERGMLLNNGMQEFLFRL